MGKYISGGLLGWIAGLLLGASLQYWTLDQPMIQAAQQDEAQANGLEDECKQTLKATGLVDEQGHGIPNPDGTCPTDRPACVGQITEPKFVPCTVTNGKVSCK